MLKNTDRLFEKKIDSACGVFEHIPFQNDEFDLVLSGYSLRDAISLKTAISEVHRVLKKDGRWVIVDLGKPDEPILRFGVTFYLRMILPIIAFIGSICVTKTTFFSLCSLTTYSTILDTRSSTLAKVSTPFSLTSSLP